MTLAALQDVVAALNRAGVRYLVAGGVAVNAHGYLRLTHDLDLVVHLDAANVRAALDALSDLGYRPILPVRAEAFADPDVRRGWIETRGLEVFSLTTDRRPSLTVDIFAAEPFDFGEEYAAALVGTLAPGLSVPFVRLPTLIAMKERSGRTRDLDDVEHLRRILEELDADA